MEVLDQDTLHNRSGSLGERIVWRHDFIGPCGEPCQPVTSECLAFASSCVRAEEMPPALYSP